MVLCPPLEKPTGHQARSHCVKSCCAVTSITLILLYQSPTARQEPPERHTSAAAKTIMSLDFKATSVLQCIKHRPDFATLAASSRPILIATESN